MRKPPRRTDTHLPGEDYPGVVEYRILVEGQILGGGIERKTKRLVTSSASWGVSYISLPQNLPPNPDAVGALSIEGILGLA